MPDAVRLALYSDLHLEFEPFAPPNLEVDVVVLAGDIAPKLNGLRFAEKLAARHQVIYVLGNHEYYGTHTHLTQKLKSQASERVHILENDVAVLAGIRFLGCTLWTDFAIAGDAITGRATAASEMNDYRSIRHVESRYKKLRPLDTSRYHAESRSWLKTKLRESFSGPTVVVTHHAPSAESIPSVQRARPIAGAYASHLDDLVRDSGAALWLHGHTHWNVDYDLGSTRVLTNQRGYPEEPADDFDVGGRVVVL